jgi:exonuclease SbcC
MRILAIRGKNLASLANEFEILLEEGPLQHAGLFAITGQTGARKSTLLDTLCLALYDQIPRLPKGNGVSIGHKDEDEDENTRINSHDVSSILRQGTANAYAEVDFIGSDKQTYRARGEISRARNNGNGRLQPQKITLINLQSNEIIGHKKTETLQEITQRIGLSFDQFRRSVLLAQGDFSAFLKVKKDERSSLLEKMTGTDIYSQLSEAAFDRATTEKQSLTAIQEKLHDKVPLFTEERLALEANNNTLDAQLSQLKTQIEDTQKQLSWYATQEQLQQEFDELQLKNTQTIKQWNTQSEQRLLLKQIDEVQVLRPLLQQQEQAGKECKSANIELKHHQQLLLTANENLPALQKQTATAETELARHKQSSQEAKPLLTKAHILDSQLLLSKLQDEHDIQKYLLQTAESSVATLTTEVKSAESNLQNYHSWQEKHAQLQPLINEWGRWESALIDLLKCKTDLDSYTHQHAQLNESILKSQSSLGQLNGEVDSF